MKRKLQAGFTLLETMVSLVVLSAVGAIVMTGMVQMMKTQGTIANRTEVHTSVRSVTELLTQEIGQAGKIALPNTVTLSAAAAAGGASITVNNTAGMFANEYLTVDGGGNQETQQIASVDSATGLTFTNPLINPHASGAAVAALGGFSSGIVPPSTLVTNGSTGSMLKLFGDINNDGNMIYVEYKCDNSTVPGFLYRQQVAFDAAQSALVSPTAAMAMLTNILANPNDPSNNVVNCFTYQTAQVGTTYFVTAVAVTLTEQTQFVDPTTRQYQQETKALLNVSPRNVIDAYMLATNGYTNRVQPTPATVTTLTASPN